jgi:hypothetical protein
VRQRPPAFSMLCSSVSAGDALTGFSFCAATNDDSRTHGVVPERGAAMNQAKKKQFIFYTRMRPMATCVSGDKASARPIH